MKQIFLLYFFISTTFLFSNDRYTDKLSFLKVKKLVKKEEFIASAYKKYIIENAKIPTLEKLKENGYLPKGFKETNLFGQMIKIINDHKIENVLPKNAKVRTNIYDYYYSNKKRKYTKAPLSKHNNTLEIVLNSKEEYILANINRITINKPDAKEKYFLDANGVLNWYDIDGNYKFSLGKDLLIDSSVDMFNNDGTTTADYNNLMLDKNILYAGQTTFYLNDDEAEEYVNIGEGFGYIKVGKDKRSLGKTIVRFTRRSGGILVNGDLYTWGNNGNKVVSIGNNIFLNKEGNKAEGKPIITTLVKMRSKLYNSNINKNDYFSSPLRPVFVDFSSDVWHSTCAITLEGELYCSGYNALKHSYINFEGFNRQNSSEIDYMYRSEFFNGKDNKAIKVFPLVQTYMVLGDKSSTSEGYMYYWGKNNKYGWAGTGKRNETNIRIPQKSGSIKFKDISFSLSIGYRRIAGLTSSGEIYLWGLDSKLVNNTSFCKHSLNKGSNLKYTENKYNLCKPLIVHSDIKFETILGGQQTFLATDKDNNFYRIRQDIGKVPEVHKIRELIDDYRDYDENNDNIILSVGISSKLDGTSLEYGAGIVWVNGKNQLKGDYFTSENVSDDFFKAAIAKIKWKKIRVVEDKNGMCGIDIYNQMYCWGAMSFYANGVNGNTFMLPVFNTNLYDLDKDFLIAEAKSQNMTNMTSGDWTRNSKGEFFIKYPTYIGGFNYEFTFK